MEPLEAPLITLGVSLSEVLAALWQRSHLEPIQAPPSSAWSLKAPALEFIFTYSPLPGDVAFHPRQEVNTRSRLQGRRRRLIRRQVSDRSAAAVPRTATGGRELEVAGFLQEWRDPERPVHPSPSGRPRKSPDVVSRRLPVPPPHPHPSSRSRLFN